MIALKVQNLTKSYKNFNLQIPELILESGYIMGLLGRNGAGKTTLIKLILDLVKRESGDVFIFEKPFNCDDVSTKQRLGVVLETPVIPGYLRTKEVKEIMKAFYKTWDDRLYKKLCDLFEIDQNKRIIQLSKGTVMKLSIALALSHKPDLLILDEPTSGLDPVARNQFVEILQEFIQAEEKAVFYSTHIVSDIENVVDFVTIIDNGKILICSSRENIQDEYCILKGSISELNKIPKNVILSIKKNSFSFEAFCKKRELEKFLQPNFVLEKPSIEKFYVTLVRRDEKDEILEVV